MAIRLRPSAIHRFPAARKTFGVLVLCATVLVPMELLGTATAGAAGPTTSVLIPANGASVSGTTTLDAAATNATGVAFYLFGGSYYGFLVGSATPTEYGWIYEWNTSTVPNGSYELFSKATGSGGSAVSSGVSVTVDNLLHTQVLVPSAGATVGGNIILDARPKGRHQSLGSRSRPPRAARSTPSGRPRRPSTAGSPSGTRGQVQGAHPRRVI